MSHVFSDCFGCCSVAQSCLIPCDPMDCSTPGFTVLHCLPEFAQTHVLWVSDAIQPSHPLSPPSPPALSLSQHQNLFQWVCSSYQVAKVLELQPSASVFSTNIQGWFPFGLTGFISLLSKGFSRVFSSTTVQKHQFFGAQPSLWYSFHVCTWLLEKPFLWLYRPLSAKWCLLFNMVSRFFIAFLPKSKRLLISWLQSPFTVIWSQENKVCHCFPIYLPWSDGNRYHDVSFLNAEL